ncbi:MAG: NAD-dependent deacylase [Clostridia bacterium]|nr:NAD-dependent deacylase [Clostridia bacterium]
MTDVAKLLTNGRRAIALTGAGISVSSGIPTFRGQGGLWSRFDPMEFAHIESFRSNPVRSWELFAELAKGLFAARPNPAHLALAELEHHGLLRCIITQNIDGLHQAAGSREVIEFHGNARELVCLNCRAHYPASMFSFDSLPPYCNCGEILKPGAVFFGEPIPKTALLRAYAESQQCQVMLVIGTSALVEPAASLPLVAKEHGAIIVEINPEPSALTATVTDYLLEGEAEVVLPQLAAAATNYLAI